MIKKLSIIGAFIGITSTASAFDLELKGGADIYSSSRMLYSLLGDKGSESFKRYHSLSMPVQHFGATAQLTYGATEGLHVGILTGLFYDRPLSEGKKTTTYIYHKDKAGNEVSNQSYDGIGKIVDHKSELHELENGGSGGFLNIPIAVLIKWDLPISTLRDYGLNSYLTSHFGLNIPISNEDSKEKCQYERNFLSPVLSIGAGLEYYNAQLQLSVDCLRNGFHHNKASKELTEHVTGSRMHETGRTINKVYSKLGFQATIGCRFSDIF